MWPLTLYAILLSINKERKCLMFLEMIIAANTWTFDSRASVYVTDFGQTAGGLAVRELSLQSEDCGFESKDR